VPLALDMTFCSVCRALAGRESQSGSVDKAVVKPVATGREVTWTRPVIQYSSLQYSLLTTWQSASRAQPSQVCQVCVLPSSVCHPKLVLCSMPMHPSALEQQQSLNVIVMRIFQVVRQHRKLTCIEHSSKLFPNPNCDWLLYVVLQPWAL